MSIKITFSEINIKPKIKKLLIIFVFVFACAATYLLGGKMNPVEVEKVINLTEKEKQEIIKKTTIESRKNWISEVEVKITLEKQKKKYENIINSIKTENKNIKDSVNVIDSIHYVYKDTIIYIEKENQNSLAFQEKNFENKQDTVYIEQQKGFFHDRFIVYAGFGPSYAKTDFLHKSSTSNTIYWKPDDWSWYWGVQFGIGVKIFSF